MIGIVANTKQRASRIQDRLRIPNKECVLFSSGLQTRGTQLDVVIFCEDVSEDMLKAVAPCSLFALKMFAYE